MTLYDSKMDFDFIKYSKFMFCKVSMYVFYKLYFFIDLQTFKFLIALNSIRTSVIREEFYRNTLFLTD